MVENEEFLVFLCAAQKKHLNRYKISLEVL